MTLRDSTRDLHHAVEQTPLGRSMADGTIGAQEWADWLQVMLDLHEHVDEWISPGLRRTEAILEDLMDLPAPRPVTAHGAFVSALWDGAVATGAAYTLCGAHLMGGKVIAARIGPRLPTRHLRFPDRKAAFAKFEALRAREDCVAGAKGCFKALLDAAKEIEAHCANLKESLNVE